MNTNKNKIVFISVVAIVILFIVAYSAMLLMGEEEGAGELGQPAVPALQEERETYSSRIEALNDLREVRRSDPPSIYSEESLDSLGVYDPSLQVKERERMVDSIYAEGWIDYEQRNWAHDLGIEEVGTQELVAGEELDTVMTPEVPFPVEVVARDFSVEHQEFFRPREISQQVEVATEYPTAVIPAKVNGEQKVRVNDRLELSLTRGVEIEGVHYPANTLLYGFVRLQPNRLHLNITHIQGRPVKLKAFDLQDSNEGIYIRNSFRAEAASQVIGDVIQDINITGVPQIRGVKNVFARQNRNIKVTVMDQYQLILKPEL